MSNSGGLARLILDASRRSWLIERGWELAVKGGEGSLAQELALGGYVGIDSLRVDLQPSHV